MAKFTGEEIVVVLVKKNKKAGDCDWAYVGDIADWDTFVDWFKPVQHMYSQVACTYEGDFKNWGELITFRKMLKNMLCLESLDFKPTESQYEWFCEVEMDMYHYFENKNFDMIKHFGQV